MERRKTSEVVVSDISIPLATYPEAMKNVVPLIDAGKTKEAKTALHVALNSLVVTDYVIPLPFIRAEENLNLANSLAEKKDRTEKENTSLAVLLEDTRFQLKMAEALGYGKNAVFKALDEQIDKIIEKTEENKYGSGYFDEILKFAVGKYQEIMDVMLPTLGAERQTTYSPFLPISPKTGHVLYVPMKSVDAAAGTITFDDEDGSEVTLKVTGGNVKLQWKPDFGMRWAALGVDFEMFGKDHQDNAPIYSKITRILGCQPPQQYVYELFLDEEGTKISKTKGNGIAVEEWLKYAPQESLSLYQFQKPRVAKKLYFDVIPKAVDEYLTFLEKYPDEELKRQVENPVWHIHGGNPPRETSPVSFALLLNLVSAANPENRDQLWGFISRYAPEASAQSHPLLDRLAGYAMAYYRDFVEPTKSYRAPNDQERAAMADLAKRLRAWGAPADQGEPQTLTFSVGKEHAFENLRGWFQALYEVLLGQSQGPRFGGFIALYGVDETAQLIEDALARA